MGYRSEKKLAGHREYMKRRYREDPVFRARHLDLVKQTKERNKERVRAEIRRLKSEPCVDCGGKFPPCVMDFDHVRGEKCMNISAMSSTSTSLRKVLAEIAKCDLVCANCHRLRTCRRRDKDCYLTGHDPGLSSEPAG